ncbi:MAG TPA: hypothetical protein VFU32_09635 [Ktedonobacterales bacterium]|nr:hypothetical protein [Ktedonobacterales bacterium]
MQQKILLSLLFLLTVILPFALVGFCLIFFWQVGQDINVFQKLSIVLFLLLVGVISLIIWLMRYYKIDNINDICNF